MNAERDFTAYVEAQLRQVPPLRDKAMAEITEWAAMPSRSRRMRVPPIEGRIRPTFGTARFVAAGITAVVLAALISSIPAALILEGAPEQQSGEIVFVHASYDQVADKALTEAPSLLAISSSGGEPVPLIDIPGTRWKIEEGPHRATGAAGNWFDDARQRNLAGPAVSWSPDGTRLAFRLFNDQPGIYVMERDSSDLRQLVALPLDQDSGMPYSAALEWSPDGTRIAYSYPAAGPSSPLFVVDVAEGQVTDLSGDDPTRWVTRTLEWSPDGSRIAFVRTIGYGLPRASRLFVMNSDGTDVRELSTGEEAYPQVYALGWSPDGSSIAFAQDMGGTASDPTRGDAPERGVLRVINADGSGLRTLAGPWDNGGCCIWMSTDQPLAWSPDGTSVAMVGMVAEGSDPRQSIVLVSADGSGERVLMEGSYFDWAPDGSQLVVAAVGGWIEQPRQSYGIYVINADGSGRRWLADGEYPAWAPTG